MVGLGSKQPIAERDSSTTYCTKVETKFHFDANPGYREFVATNSCSFAVPCFTFGWYANSAGSVLSLKDEYTLRPTESHVTKVFGSKPTPSYATAICDKF